MTRLTLSSLLLICLLALAEGQTVETPADDIPENIKPFLAENGGVFISGGLTSVGRMVIFDVDTKRVTFLEGNTTGQAVNPETATKTELTLSKEKAKELEKIIWRIIPSPQLFMNSQPSADFDTVLTLRSRGFIRVIQSYGPPVSYVEDLYTFLWNLEK